jgi:hypothetical protein
VKDRDYRKEELVKMWEQSDIRKRAILSLLMTGIRKGAIPELRYGNLAKITIYKDRERIEHKFPSHLYKLIVYEGNESEYVAFLTPGGAAAIDRYIETRVTAGEKITPTSPLIRDAFDSLNAGQPRPITTAALDMLFTRLTRSVGIRPKSKEGKRQARHEMMLFHAMRKYVNHCFVNAGVEVIKKELLLGHSAPGLEGSYLRPTEDELLAEFVKVIPHLTLDESDELRREVEKLKVDTADFEMMKKMHLDMKMQLEEERERNALMIQYVMEPDSNKKAEISKRLIERGYRPKTF